MSGILATAVEGDLQWAWWLTLGAGLAVAIVVATLLHVLLQTVRQIDDGLEAAWNMGTQVARNTATSWIMIDVARMVERASDEGVAGTRSRGGA